MRCSAMLTVGPLFLYRVAELCFDLGQVEIAEAPFGPVKRCPARFPGCLSVSIVAPFGVGGRASIRVQEAHTANRKRRPGRLVEVLLTRGVPRVSTNLALGGLARGHSTLTSLHRHERTGKRPNCLCRRRRLYCARPRPRSRELPIMGVQTGACRVKASRLLTNSAISSPQDVVLPP